MKHIPALLSFCLPGLGQLSQKRWLPAVAFFFCFALCLLLKVPWPLVPLVALAAGGEALRKPPTVVADKNLRAMYGVVAAMGLLAWVSFVGVSALPLELK